MIMNTIAIIMAIIGGVLLLISTLPPINLKFLVIGAFLMMGSLLFNFVPALINANHNAKYTSVERIDDNKYIQCINGIKILILQNSSRGSNDNATVLLDEDAKPISCQTVTYTYEQTQSLENKDKYFVIIQ